MKTWPAPLASRDCRGLKDVTPDAVGISGLAAAKEAVTQAEDERRIVEMERKRLRMEEAEREGR